MLIPINKFKASLKDKPDNIRLGQWFVLKCVAPSLCNDMTMQLFQLDGKEAKDKINQIMRELQYEEL